MTSVTSDKTSVTTRDLFDDWHSMQRDLGARARLAAHYRLVGWLLGEMEQLPPDRVEALYRFMHDITQEEKKR